MSTAIRGSLTDHSPKDGSGDEINGSEVDENSYILADILDGSTATDLGGAGAVDYLALRSIVLDNAAGSIKVPYTLEWDPEDGLQMTDNSSGIGVDFKMPDDGDTQTVFARLAVICVADGAASLEEGEYSFRLAKAGTVTEIMTLAPTTGLTLGVDDTGYDLKAFGATAGAYILWDESADTLKLVGGAKTDLQGTMTVGVDGTGYDVLLYSATSGKSLLWDESADKLIVTGDVAITGAMTFTGDLALDGDLDFTGAQEITTTAGALTLSPATDVLIADGKGLVVGHTAQVTSNAGPSEVQVLGTGYVDASVNIGRWSADASGPFLVFTKSRNATIGSSTIVNNSDYAGSIAGAVDDGGDFVSRIAEIDFQVDDASPAADQIGGSIILSTTPVTSNAPLERVRITSGGVLTTTGGATTNVTAAGSVVATGGIAFTDVAAAHIDDATHGAGTTTIYIGNETIDTTASDMRLKENITAPNGTAQSHLSILSSLLKEYDYKNGTGRFVGLVAQDVLRALPIYVVGNEEQYSLRYNYMVGPLLFGWDDHEQRLAELERKAA